jgi:hypothetical protein
MKRKQSLLGAILFVVTLIGISCASPKYATVTPELHSQFIRDLKVGNLNLDCDTPECYLSWGEHRNELISSYNSRQWEPLAELVMKIGYGQDLAYYFLGMSAEGLGYHEAALKYYRQSGTTSGDSRKLHHCRETVRGCGGLELASVLPQRIAAVTAMAQTTGRSSKSRDHHKLSGEHDLAKNESKTVSDKKPVTGQILDNLEICQYKFKNGKYKEKIERDDQGPDDPVVWDTVGIAKKAFGDLDGDGVIDGAVVLWRNTGGSGIMVGIAAAIAAQGNPTISKVITLGDRVEVKSMNIEHGIIVVRLLTHGPRDGLCCPTVKSVYKFKLSGIHLVNLTPTARENQLQDSECTFFYE